jgi:hypothetical protein
MWLRRQQREANFIVSVEWGESSQRRQALGRLQQRHFAKHNLVISIGVSSQKER